MTKKLLLILTTGASLFTSCRKDLPESKTTQVLIPGPQSLYEVSGTMNTVPGIILLTPSDRSPSSVNQYLMMTNERGEILYNKQLPGAGYNFQKWNIDGKVRYTYLFNDPSSFHLPGMSNGPAVILDELLVEIKRVNLLSNNDIIASSNKPNLDIHDFILLSDDHYITMAYYPKQVTNIPAHLNPAARVTVHANIIQEVRNGSVIWQWDATDYPELYETSVQGNDFTDSTRILDYLHINSFFIDPRDGNLICSFRNTDQVLKINRKTGDIIWRLGGKNSDFALTPHQYFLKQHNATLVDNNQTLLLFDNGDGSRPYSRILEYKLDESSKTVTGFKAFNIPAPYTAFTGGVQKLGSNYFIGGGSGNYILEINPETGERILEMKGPPLYLTYRAHKYLN